MKSENNDKVSITAKRAEAALRELIANGQKVNQHAVEKYAGIANGSLNYNVPEYIDLKKRIQAVKAVGASKKGGQTNKDQLAKQVELKRRYKNERDKLREEIKKVKGANLELIVNISEQQRYITYLENKEVATIKVVDFNTKKNSGRSN
jgi:hypothetical protein